LKRENLSELPLAEFIGPIPGTSLPHDTTILLVIDAKGRLAAGVSTSGWSYKYPGRLGDAAVIGGGLYAHDKFGACGCTHAGEGAIRAAIASSVITRMRFGASVAEACRAVMWEHIEERGNREPVIMHAIDAAGAECVLSSVSKETNLPYFIWRAGMADYERREALRL
jgi:isoaspartyl peptidase/L-asparaginase-like protein (Ntn-hydrolase superfamily)